jgi:UDP-glucose 4-epimerase
MDNKYLEDLIQEMNSHDGGFIVHSEFKPEAVVLSIEKYNQLLQNSLGLGAVDAVRTAVEGILATGNPSPVHKNILVTGGAGYIGAHVCRELIKAGHGVTVIDNLSTGKRENIPAEVKFLEGDVKDANFLRDVFSANEIYAVVHMAADIEVEESVRAPEKYLQNNTLNTVQLLNIMNEYGVRNIIFSSTAAVYGEQEEMPVKETARLRPNNPYGYSKLMAEKMIKYYSNYLGFRSVVFRYFNACGCDFDGQVRATHESHLIPIVMEVVGGKRAVLNVYGSDYQTPDGTAVRDYVHVLDIARAHAAAVEKMEEGDSIRIYNIGTGTGLSVLEIINKASEVTNKMVPMQLQPRRAGDPPQTVADNSKIRRELGFELLYSDPETILSTAWNQFQSQAR